MANEETNIVHELDVIKDNEQSGGFSFDDGYYGDAVRAAVHSALIKIDALLDFTPSGGGDVPIPDPVELHFAYVGFGYRVCQHGFIPPSTIFGFATIEQIEPEEEEGE